MKPSVWIVAAVVVAGCSGPSVGDDGLHVTDATLRPSRIVLTVSNGSADAAHVAQVIVNDAFVDFRQTRRRVAPGQSTRVTVFYAWLSGEGYDVELMTSTGATVDYEIEDASAGPVAA